MIQAGCGDRSMDISMKIVCSNWVVPGAKC